MSNVRVAQPYRKRRQYRPCNGIVNLAIWLYLNGLKRIHPLLHISNQIPQTTKCLLNGRIALSSLKQRSNTCTFLQIRFTANELSFSLCFFDPLHLPSATILITLTQQLLQAYPITCRLQLAKLK